MMMMMNVFFPIHCALQDGFGEPDERFAVCLSLQ